MCATMTVISTTSVADEKAGFRPQIYVDLVEAELAAIETHNVHIYDAYLKKLVPIRIAGIRICAGKIDAHSKIASEEVRLGTMFVQIRWVDTRR